MLEIFERLALAAGREVMRVFHAGCAVDCGKSQVSQALTGNRCRCSRQPQCHILSLSHLRNLFSATTMHRCDLEPFERKQAEMAKPAAGN